MEQKRFLRFWLFSLALVLVLSLYPLWMGLRVATDMLRNGTVLAADYPKYIIPYTPMALAVITGVALMPLLSRCPKRPGLWASLIAVVVFLLAELVLESLVIITATVVTTLESWQMYMCYVPPEMYETRQWTPIDILIGEYSPAFKFHFYLIALVLILGMIGCFYGFGKMLRTGNRENRSRLIIASAATAALLAMSILACFTAFFRTGELVVSPLSAVLMALFFWLLGITAGCWVGMSLPEKAKKFAPWLPSGAAAVTVLAMYLGEMILLSGNLYRFGTGVFFSPLGPLVLAPVDLLIILLSAAATWRIQAALRTDP